MEQNYIIKDSRCVICLEQIQNNELKTDFKCGCFFEIHINCYNTYYNQSKIKKCLICKKTDIDYYFKIINPIIKKYEKIYNDFVILKKYIHKFI